MPSRKRQNPVKDTTATRKATSILQADNSAPLLQWPVLLVYAILVLYGVTIHEPWRDEAQAWLLVRDLSLIDLLKLLPSEGHPPLWYLLIMPLAKSGMPYASEHILTAGIMIAAVYLLLFKTKVFLPVRLLLPFSYYFLYEYSLLARSYCLGAFFVVAIAALYPARFQKNWLFAFCVAALFNSHALVFGLAGVLLLLYFWDAVQQKRLHGQILFSTIFMGISGAVVFYFLLFSKTQNNFESIVSNHQERIMLAISEGLFAMPEIPLAAALLLLAAILSAVRPKVLVVLTGGVVCIMYILGYKYPGDFRHHGLILMVVFLVLTIAFSYRNETIGLAKRYGGASLAVGNWLMVLFLVVQLKPSIDAYIKDVDNIYSDGRNVAAFLKENDLDRSVIVSHQAWAGTAVLPYLDSRKKFFYAEAREYGSFYRFDPWFNIMYWSYGPEYALNVAYENFRGRLENVLLVLNGPLQPIGLQHVDLLYATPELTIREDEMFYIYRFKRGLK